MRWAIAVVALGLAACSSGGGSGGADVGEAAAVPATTSTTISAEDSFRAEVSVKMGWRGADADAALASVTAVCDSLTAGSAETLAGDDAPNDSPESDAAIAGLMGTMTLDLAFDEYSGPDDLLAELLTVGAEHLCPEHEQVVADYITALGVTVPG